MTLAEDQAVIERYYRAMEAGSVAEMDTLFADDAIYSEPFSQMGQVTTHQGRTAIVAFLAAGFEGPNSGVTITLDRIDIDGDDVIAEWTCVGPNLPGPMRGHDSYRVREKRIMRLDTRLGPA